MRSEVERHPSGHGCCVRRVGVGSDGTRTEHVMAHDVGTTVANYLLASGYAIPIRWEPGV